MVDGPATEADPTESTDSIRVVDDDSASSIPVATSESRAQIWPRAAEGCAGRAWVALLPRLVRITASIAGGVLLCVSFPPFGWWYTAVFAFALLAWVLTGDETTRAGGLGFGFLFGLAFNVPLLPWTSELVGAGPWLALATMSALFPALFGLVAVAVRNLWGWPIWFAALWVATEWAKGTVPFGGFPWGVAAFGQTTGPFLVIAHLGGAPLLSFAITLSGFSIAALAMEIVRWWRAGERASGDVASAPPAVVLPGICICVVLLATAVVWPSVHKSGAGSGEDPNVVVAAVQGNVPRLGLEFNAQRRAVLDYHVNETLRLAEDVRRGAQAQPVFVVWPENSSDIDPLANADAAAQITVAADAIGVPILVGGVVAGAGYTRELPVSTNTVIVWDPVTGPGERHDKQIVQPFGEYLPWRGFFRHFSEYADRAGYFVPGDGTGVVHANGIPIGVATCWEVIFDRALRESVNNGAQILTVPTNNALFGEAMSEQQLAFSALRAVEHDRYVIVAGTTGISAIVAPDGHVISRTGFFEPAFLDEHVRLKTSITPATRWGPLVQWVLVAVGVGAVAAAMLHNGVFMRRRRPTEDPGTAPEPDPDLDDEHNPPHGESADVATPASGAQTEEPDGQR
ncbi:MAG: apolipoprotein N-acyltransferase [Mycobacterium sp.]